MNMLGEEPYQAAAATRNVFLPRSGKRGRFLVLLENTACGASLNAGHEKADLTLEWEQMPALRLGHK